jgi:methylglutaconyl-CoA hydratase
MPEDKVEGFVASLRNAFTALENLPFPTIAAIEGVALGGGLELAMACDLRIAGEKALLGLPETSLAIIPGAGGTQRLPRIVGVAKAKELTFLSKRISSQAAANIGLVTESVPAGSAVTRAHELAVTVASGGPIAQRAAKRAITGGIQLPMEKALLFEKECYSQVIKTLDRKEGLAAFVEKRTPKYIGK